MLVPILALSACKKEDIEPENSTENLNKPVSTSINKIMPLGASRVEGARPDYESYRYELWKDLKAGGWTFDYVGTNTDNASYPDVSGNTFDPDHEGRGGWTSGQILAGLDGWLSSTGSPDIVLFSSPGGNDALENQSYSEAITNINAIIDQLQANNPNVTIIIEQMAPAHSNAMTPELTTYLNNLHQEMANIASAQTTSTSQVLTIDMATGFTDGMLADDVHYNESGADFIAGRYYSVLVNVLQE